MKSYGGTIRAVAPAALALMFASASFTSAQAAPVIFSGIDNASSEAALAATPNSDAARNSFFSNLAGVGTETFESQVAGTVAPLAISFGVAGTATLNGAGIVVSVPVGTTNGFGRYSVPSATSTKFWEVTAGTGGNFSVAFSIPIAAFGFYGIDIGDVSGTLRLALTDTNSVVTNLLVPAAAVNAANASVLYFGFYDASVQYTSIAFNSTAGSGSGDVFAFDNFSIGSFEQVVTRTPEPMSIALLGTALLGIGLVRRRRS